MPPRPTRVAWTDHALVKASVLGLARLDVERWIIEEHATRVRNAGNADWRVTHGRIVIVYNHPDGDDHAMARIVTVWRRR